MSNKKKMKKNVPSEWAYLPEHLVEDVLDRFVEVSDYVRFSVVCKSWLSTAQFHLKQWRIKSSEKQIPMLLIQNRRSIKKQRLHSVVTGKDQLQIKKAANLHVPGYMCKDTKIRSCGSSHGWLIFIRNDTLALILLYNPFTKSTINLPPIFDIPKHVSATLTSALERFKTVVLSEDPSLHPDTYQVLVMYDWEFIWLFRSRSDSWVRVKKPEIPQNPDADNIYDVCSYNNIPHAIYYRGKFYIAGKRFIINIVDEEECCAIYQHLGFQQLTSDSNILQKYMVELCNGCLLYIERVAYALRMFNVYELDLNHEDGPMCSSLLTSLGGETLFLGFNYSFSLSASACKPDCIYYTGHDDLDNTGVYYIRRERTKRLNHPSINHRPANIPATWIVPHPNLNTSY